MGSGYDRGGIMMDSQADRGLAPRCYASAVGYWGREGLTGEHQVVRRNTHTVEVGDFSLVGIDARPNRGGWRRHRRR